MFKKALGFCIGLSLLVSGAQAQEAERLAAAVPAEVTEIATAGTWTDGKDSGVFRAIVLTTPAKDTTQAHLIVQLMSVSADGTTSKVAKSVDVKQITEKKLPNAFLAVEEDSSENEITWRLTSYDANTDTDNATLIKIDAKGVLDVKSAPKDDAATPGAQPKQ
jgi:hypothetical protein